MSLFGTSGIRGVANSELDPFLAMKVGYGIGSCLDPGEEVVVGRDTRKGAKMIENALISGLLSSGIDVIDLGVSPTPLLGFSVRALGASMGIEITASHNPPEYVGIKVFSEDGSPASREVERKIEEKVMSGEIRKVPWSEIGKIREAEVEEEYLKEVKRKIKLSSPLSVVVDPGGGAASKLGIEAQQEIGNEVVSINSRETWYFPRGLEPSKENLLVLSEVVKASHADLGIAYDGDGDRVGIILKGGIFPGWDRLLAFVAEKACERDLVKRCVVTVDAGIEVLEHLRRRGIEVIISKVGDVEVAEEIKASESSFGGEPSGTWIFPSWGMTPDGIFSGLFFSEICSKENVFKELFSIPEYPKKRVKVKCKEEEKEKILRVRDDALLKVFPRSTILRKDGIKVMGQDYFVLIRPSGTEPVIRITAEAKSEDRLREILKKALRLVSLLRGESR